MSRHADVCRWLERFAEQYPDASVSLGAHAGSIQSLILRHPESQQDPNEEVRRLRSVLQSIASSPERYRKSNGDEVGPEWVLHDIKIMASQALAEKE